MKKQSNGEVKLNNTSGYASINGLRMYYEIYGNGEPLILVHGGGSTIQTSFGRIIPNLAKSFKVIAVEMQAHGRTLDINRDLSFEQDADDIAALLSYLKLDNAHVFGFSNGANTALQFAIRHPDMTNKIIIASTFYKRKGAPEWFWDMMSKPSFEAMPKPYKDAFLEVNPDTAALRQMYQRDVARMLAFPDILDIQMESIKAPALIISGDKDVATVEHTIEMKHLLKNSRLAIIPGGHGEYIGEITMPQNTAVIAATVSMIIKFLTETVEHK